MNNAHFIAQAADYMGTPHRIARCSDSYGEQHVVIELRFEDGTAFWLDWIGAELASEPDEMDEVPFQGLQWQPITSASEGV